MTHRAAAGLAGTRETPVVRVHEGRIGPAGQDVVAVEEPLEIQLGYSDGARQLRTLTITMRTPGNDRELAAGCLYGEGIVSHQLEISAILEGRNSVRVELRADVTVDWSRLERRFYTSSSCGLCGKVCIEAVAETHFSALPQGPVIRADVLSRMPERLRAAQEGFDSTGGLHAAALFSSHGEIRALYEDVGRHNAVDKLIGAELLAGRIPLHDNVLLVSGRASFELVQKAVAAGVPVMAAIGAPSSLAVELAREADMTLAGFVRDGRFNIYSGESRVEGSR
jgi:FdhD protein